MYICMWVSIFSSFYVVAHFLTPYDAFGPSRTRGQNCLFMSKICHHNENPSATGLSTKGQSLVAGGQTSKMPSTTFGAGQIETNFGKQ